jgi:nucleotide-binding universal stress UspA family protein
MTSWTAVGLVEETRMTTPALVTSVAIRNILYATDFSTYSAAALPYAIAIAHQYEAKLFAVHVLTPSSYLLFASPESWPAILESEEEKQQLNAERLEAQLRGVRHEIVNSAGDIPEVIFRLVRERQIDMMVLGTHGRTGLPKLLMGSVAEKIFRHASVPVMTVGPNVRPARKTVAELNSILFATDFSRESLAALPYAVSLAQEHQARLSLLHVVADETGISKQVENRLRELVPAALFEPKYVVRAGDDLAEQVLRFAEESRTDLIVLGIRAPHRNVTALTHLANTPLQQIVANANCPVVTVRG